MDVQNTFSSLGAFLGAIYEFHITIEATQIWKAKLVSKLVQFCVTIEVFCKYYLFVGHVARAIFGLIQVYFVKNAVSMCLCLQKIVISHQSVVQKCGTWFCQSCYTWLKLPSLTLGIHSEFVPLSIYGVYYRYVINSQC